MDIKNGEDQAVNCLKCDEDCEMRKIIEKIKQVKCVKNEKNKSKERYDRIEKNAKINHWITKALEMKVIGGLDLNNGDDYRLLVTNILNNLEIDDLIKIKE